MRFPSEDASRLGDRYPDLMLPSSDDSLDADGNNKNVVCGHSSHVVVLSQAEMTTSEIGEPWRASRFRLSEDQIRSCLGHHRTDTHNFISYSLTLSFVELLSFVGVADRSWVVDVRKHCE